MRLKDKVAIVTGAASGIGKEIAIAFAREGATVIASDLNEAGMAGLQAQGVAECLRLDARDSAAIEAAAKRLGSIDVLFNAAGFVHHGSVLEATDQEWDFAFDLNVKSMHRTIKAFLPGMLAKGGGSIINIASTVGASKAAPNRYVYGASKAAVVGLTKAYALELAKTEVTEKFNSLLRGSVTGLVAGVFVLLALALGMHGFAWLLNDLFFGDEAWPGYFIEAAIFLLIAAGAGLFAYRAVQAGAPPLPEQAIEEAKRTKAVLEGDVR